MEIFTKKRILSWKQLCRTTFWLQFYKSTHVTGKDENEIYSDAELFSLGNIPFIFSPSPTASNPSARSYQPDFQHAPRVLSTSLRPHDSAPARAAVIFHLDKRKRCSLASLPLLFALFWFRLHAAAGVIHFQWKSDGISFCLNPSRAFPSGIQ